MSLALVWFRDDLRLADNPALQAALRAGHAPVPVYVHAPDEDGDWRPGAASDAWRHRALAALDASLRARGSRLQHLSGPSQQALEQAVAETGAEAVYWNDRHVPAAQARDDRIRRALRARGLHVERHDAALLFAPEQLHTQAGDPFRVFTPFWRAAQAHWQPQALREAPAALPAPPRLARALPLAQLGLAPRPAWDAGFWDTWTPGEAGALAALDRFVREALADYPVARDLPDRAGTSRLSPHLHFGEISPWRIARAVEGLPGAEAFVRELGWREFAHHVLHHFPHTPVRNFKPQFDDFAWARADPALLAAWREGRTGIPIVDAGMRELWHTGWMHNRVRMVVASLLTKHLRVHWSEGARWFWDTLVDADLANNSLGWQWVAGTGVDAAPYFRIFNPVLQGQRFDPRGDYVTRWIPELAALPAKARHAPWEQPGARLGDYPARPVVDLGEGRAAALAAFAKVRAGGG